MERAMTVIESAPLGQNETSNGVRMSFSRGTQHPLLAAVNLSVCVEHEGTRDAVVDGLSFEVSRRETLAIIGETGSGKSLTCRAIVGLLPPSMKATGSVRFEGKELLGLNERKIRPYRGAAIGMVFQDAERALNPTMPIGYQITEAIRAHNQVGAKAARARALELLHLLRLPAPPQQFFSYPHELSGGMRQRVMIGVAIAANPKLLIADEPTSAVDVSTGGRIMELLMDLQRQLDMAVILVSHDLRLVTSFADAVLVVRRGRSVEYSPTHELICNPKTEYSKALLAAIPHFGPFDQSAHITQRSPIAAEADAVHSSLSQPPRVSSHDAPLLMVRNVAYQLAIRRAWGTASRTAEIISRVSFEVRAGEIFSIVGETGAGKSTLARAILQIPPPTSGEVMFRGEDLAQLRGRRLRDHRRHMQIVFQDPFASVNPRWNVSEVVEEPLIGHKYGGRKKRAHRVEEVLNLVGLPAPTFGHRRPRDLSGGECQRVAIARALAFDPALVICDEAVSSLDALVRQQIVSLFRQMRAQLGVAFLFISHDLAVVRNISDRVGVMYRGRLCEIGPAELLCREPLHPYTVTLLAAMTMKRRAAPDPPVPSHLSTGCRFQARCDRAQERCSFDDPQLRRIASNHFVACHFPIPRRAGSLTAERTNQPDPVASVVDHNH
jgi:peptide/nickel transport system ATP-binding protein